MSTYIAGHKILYIIHKKLKRNAGQWLKSGRIKCRESEKATGEKGRWREKKEKCRKGFCNLGIVVLCRLHGDRHKGPWLAIDG